MEDAPPVAPTSSTPPVAAPAVTDRRPSPRGVLPRGVQTWLLAGLTACMLLIMFRARQAGVPCLTRAGGSSRCRPERRPRARLPRPSAIEAQTLSQVAEQQTAPVVDPSVRTWPLPLYAPPENRSAPTLVLGETHFDTTAGRAPSPSWLTIPERGLYTGVMVLGAVGTGKTSASMYS